MRKIFTSLSVVALVATTNAQVVINEIHTGGGTNVNTAIYKYDFIELKNIGTTSVTLTNAYLYYAAPTSSFTDNHAIPTVTLAPGQTYLIQEGNAGPKGTDLPVTPDLVGNLNLATINGKVALTTDGTAPTSPTSTNVLDFVGYGSANQFEGSSSATQPSVILSISRISGDTNDNAADFATGTPSPQNSMGATLGVSDVKNVRSLFVKNTLVKNDEIIFGEKANNVKIYGMSGQLIKTINSLKTNNVNVADLPKGNYIVVGTVDNQLVSQKIMKD